MGALGGGKGLDPSLLGFFNKGIFSVNWVSARGYSEMPDLFPCRTSSFFLREQLNDSQNLSNVQANTTRVS